MTTSTRTRGPYAKTKRVREHILAVATKEFGRSGYRAATMKDIAAAAGISEGGLAHHFDNKDELLTAVLEWREAQAAKDLSLDAGPAAFEAMLRIIVEDSLQSGIVGLHTTIAAEATSADHPAHEHYARRYEGVRALATRTFDAIAKEGRLRSTLTPTQLGASLVAMMDGLQLQWLYDSESVRPAETLRAFLDSVIDAPGS